MESLRRLTSSVFDSNSRLGGVVRRNSGSSSSNNAPVYGDDDARALGMTFITERLIVTGYPVHTPTNKKTNEINVDELAQYLETHHSNHYLAFNLNSLEEAAEANGGACPSPADRHHPSLMDQLLRKTPSPSSYANHNAGSTSADAARAIAEKVREQMLEFSWERDGMKAHTPPFDLIFRICYSIFAWLSLDSQNVALVHCLSGKTRSGVIVACYLLFARLADDPIDAFVEFYKKRWEMYALTPQALRSKTPPSIQRFLASFHELIEYQKPPHDKPMLLKAIIFRALPVELQPCVQIWDDYKMIFCTDSLPASMDAKDAPVLDWNGDDGFFAILWENGIDLDGGFSILCSFGDEYGNDDEVDASSRVLFRYADSTWFLNPGLVTLTKHKLDMMKQYEHGFDEDLFSVDLVLHDSAKPRKNYVRLDYTGNNAVRQGLIEITKHHLVLPDPAMHSNFIRMGFGETPTTFALQRSQNTPNVALDLLHSEGLAACFASETPARSAQDEEIAASEGSSMPTVGVESMKTASAAPLRRQTTAEIVAMQSQRSKYSIPTAADVFVCHTCNDDDYMMRPQIVRCTGRCGHFYHTTCVGLRKIPFGLTTMSDRTNHGVYMKKFFSAWECDACAPPPAEAATKSKTAVEVPPDMTLVPSSWVNSYVPSAATGDHEKTNGPTQVGSSSQVSQVQVSSSGDVVAKTGESHAIRTPSVAKNHDIGKQAASDREPSNNQNEAGDSFGKIDKLREFLLASGVSVEDLLRAATTPNVSITPATNVVLDGNSPIQKTMNGDGGGSPSSKSSHSSLANDLQLSRDTESASSGASSTEAEKVDMSPRKVEPATPSTNHHTVVSTMSSQHLSNESAHRNIGIAQSKVTKAEQPVSAEKDDKTAKPQAPDLKTAFLKDIATLSKSRDLDSSNQTASESIAAAASITSAKYEMMLKRGVPFEAVQNCMIKDGADPTALQYPQSEATKSPPSPPKESSIAPSLKLKDVEEFKSYFNMLRLGCPKDAVKQKLIMDGLDPSIIDFGPDANYDEVKDKIAHVLPIEERSRLQDDIKNVREPKRQGAREADKQPFTSAKVSEEPSASTEESRSTKPDDVPLRDHEIYSKYFKMLKMGLPEDAVRHKIKSDGADERALELGGDAPFSKLAETAAVATLGEDPVYAKYFKMLKMGLPEGAVRHKMVQDEVDPKALELGPDAPVTGLTKASGAPSASKQAQGLKPKPRRKKLHWQAISEDRLSSIGQQTIWEDKDEDAVEFDMDMDELESLFFANNDANSTGSSSKKKPGHGAAQPLKRKQSVTLIDGKRAMNAAISLARVKLSYSEIADAVRAFDPKSLTMEQLIGINEFLPTPEEVAVVSAYSGDVTILGEAEKFILEISKVERYATRMECLVFKLAFAPRSAELAASYTNMIKASEEVKGSRLLKILLSMVLKLGNTLNGSGDDNGIRGFTVDSLLRLGHTKAVNQKTTVLHYLVRLVKKNHPQVLDFQQELQCVPLAARESFDTIGEDFAKLQAGFARMTTELEFLQKQASNDAQAVATAKSMQDAVSAIGAQMQKLEQEIQRAREEVASVFDYFGEDPNRNPTDFFTTLTSFCTAFECARKEVDAADEASLRAERLKLRRSGSVARPPAKGGSKEAGGVVASAFQLRLRERAQSGDLATRHSTTNM